MGEPRRVSIDFDNLDLQRGTREAMRLLASAHTDAQAHLREVAFVVTDMLDGLDLRALDVATVRALRDRNAEVMLGLTMIGHGALEALAVKGIDRLEFLKVLEDVQERVIREAEERAIEDARVDD